MRISKEQRALHKLLELQRRRIFDEAGARKWMPRAEFNKMLRPDSLTPEMRTKLATMRGDPMMRGILESPLGTPLPSITDTSKVPLPRRDGSRRPLSSSGSVRPSSRSGRPGSRGGGVVGGNNDDFLGATFSGPFGGGGGGRPSSRGSDGFGGFGRPSSRGGFDRPPSRGAHDTLPLDAIPSNNAAAGDPWRRRPGSAGRPLSRCGSEASYDGAYDAFDNDGGAGDGGYGDDRETYLGYAPSIPNSSQRRPSSARRIEALEESLTEERRSRQRLESQLDMLQKLLSKQLVPRTGRTYRKPWSEGVTEVSPEQRKGAVRADRVRMEYDRNARKHRGKDARNPFSGELISKERTARRKLAEPRVGTAGVSSGIAVHGIGAIGH